MIIKRISKHKISPLENGYVNPSQAKVFFVINKIWQYACYDKTNIFLKSYKILFLFFFFFLLFLWGIGVKAQDIPPLQAQVDRDALVFGETFNLTITVTADGLNTPRPSLPALTGIDVIGSSTSSQISIVNAKINSQASYVYTLRPTQNGTLTIPAINLTMNGQVYNTLPIIIKVTASAQDAEPPSLTPQTMRKAGEDYFVEAEVDEKTPYMGQQVVYTFRFYRALRLFDQPYYNVPAFQGFWTDAKTQKSQNSVQIDARLYSVTELKTIIYPTYAGEISIEPARMTIPGGFFESDTILQTESIILNVKPLPQDAPMDFSGFVGQMQLSTEISAQSVKVNEPITLKTILRGSGNLNNLKAPRYPAMEGWRTYESKSAANANQKQDERVFERILVPQKEGQQTIPAIHFIFFDPEKGAYRTLESEPILVEVKPSDSTPMPPAPRSSQDVLPLGDDIRYIKQASMKLPLKQAPITDKALYWLCYTLPLLGLGIHFTLSWQEKKRLIDGGSFRRSRAFATAKKKLNADEVSSKAAQILTQYLSERMQTPVSGLTYEILKVRLHEHGITQDLIERVLACLYQSDVGRYAPQLESSSTSLEQIMKMLVELERAFK